MLILNASKREVVGKPLATLRRAGFVPSVLYGNKVVTTNLTLHKKEFLGVYREAGENTLIEVVITNNDGGEERFPVLIHDVPKDNLTRDVLHVDLYAVALDEVTQAMVSIEFIDVAPVEEDLHGIVVKVASEIEVEALPQHLPHEITVSLSSLTTFDSQIHAKDIMLPEGVVLVTDPEMVLVSVSEPLSEEEIKEMEEEGVGGVETVKVETEEKKLQREEENSRVEEE
ncbi:MAG: 50S ribosomal protein L25 [Parcubacteria group bacterium]|nr:50S ribosomal protein L25 [Parcubacteria group bacterium]